MLYLQSVVKKDYILTFSLRGLSKEPTIRTAIDGEKFKKIFEQLANQFFSFYQTQKAMPG